MSDIFSKSKRSEIMSKISGKETKPEVLVRKYLFSEGFRFRKNVKNLPGKPDIVLPKYRVVILIHGCFWHGHSCSKGALPASNREFWLEKISKNKERDDSTVNKLKLLGWQVIIIWQCELSNKEKRDQRLTGLIKNIRECEITNTPTIV